MEFNLKFGAGGGEGGRSKAGKKVSAGPDNSLQVRQEAVPDALAREKRRWEGAVPRALKFRSWDSCGRRWLYQGSAMLAGLFILWVAVLSVLPFAASKLGAAASARVLEVKRSAGRTTTFSCRLGYMDMSGYDRQATVGIPFPSYQALKPGTPVRIRYLRAFPRQPSLEGNELFQLQGAVMTGPFFLLLALFCFIFGPAAVWREYRLMSRGRPVPGTAQAVRPSVTLVPVSYEWNGRALSGRFRGKELGLDLGPGARVLMLVDPERPESAMLVSERSFFELAEGSGPVPV